MCSHVHVLSHRVALLLYESLTANRERKDLIVIRQIQSSCFYCTFILKNIHSVSFRSTNTFSNHSLLCVTSETGWRTSVLVANSHTHQQTLQTLQTLNVVGFWWVIFTLPVIWVKLVIIVAEISLWLLLATHRSLAWSVSTPNKEHL